MSSANLLRQGFFLGIASLVLFVYPLHSQAAQDTSAIARAVTPSNFDTTCSPCKDFYSYVNGGWMKRTPFPSFRDNVVGSGTFGGARNQGSLFVANAVRLASRAATSASLATKPVSGDTSIASSERLVGVLYNRCMDDKSIESGGIKPLQPWLERIDAIRSNTDIIKTAALMDLNGIDVMLHLTTNRNVPAIRMLGDIQPGGIGLNSPELYTGQDSASLAARRFYAEHIANVLSLLGIQPTEVAVQANKVVALEATFGRYQLTDSTVRISQLTNNPISLQDLHKLAPAIAWEDYFQVFGMASLPAMINVQRPAFLAAVDTALKNYPVSVWKTYLKLRLVDQFAEALPAVFGKEYASYSDRLNNTVGGGEARNCLSSVVDLLPGGVWQLYVASFDTTTHGDSKEAALDNINVVQSEVTKKAILTLVDNMKAAFQHRLESVKWMSDSVKKEFQKKVAAIKAEFRYPEYQSVDYSGLTLTPSSYIQNIQEILRYNRMRELEQVGKSSNLAPWGMPPTEVNAYYFSHNNGIVFPVGILVPPFFDPEADDAVNYGGIGVIVGHELTHALTGPARQFSEALVRQYDSYKVADNLYVNGRHTLDENLADLGGILISYDALQIALKDKYRTLIDGFTPEQRFFISFANSHRKKLHLEDTKRLARMDSHSPADWRVKGVLTNMPAFAEAFHCLPGDPLNPPVDKRVIVW